MDQTPTLFEKKGFGGSFTDNVYSNDPMLCAYNNNLLVNNNEKYYVRPGSVVYLPAVTTLSAQDYKISHFFKFKDESYTFVAVGTNLYRMTGAAFTALTGPSGDVAFTGHSDATNYQDYSEWRGHLYILDTQAALKPMKVYADSGGTWRLRTTGMPEVAATANYVDATLLASTIVIANHARTALLAHYANTSAHPAAHTAATAALTASAATDLATLITLVTQLMRSYAIHMDDITLGGAYHYADDLRPTLPEATIADQLLVVSNPPETLLECVTRLNDISSKWGTHVLTTDYHFDTSAEFASLFFADELQLGNSVGPAIFLNTATIYAYANAVKTKLNAHMASVDTVLPYNVWKHNVAADATNTVSSANATTPLTLRALVSEMVRDYNTHHDDADLQAITSNAYHIANTNDSWYTSPYVLSAGSTGDLFQGIGPGAWATTLSWLDKIRVAYNGHVNDGLNPVDTLKPHGDTYPGGVGDKNTFLIPGPSLTFADYIYGFCWKYEYTVGTQTFIDRGPFTIVVPNYGAVGAETDVDEIRSASVISINYEGLALTNLPVYANLTGENYDTANMYLEIYRTTDDGNVLYLVDAVVNGTTSYTDRVKDAELQTRERAYITGGVVDNDAPPISKCLHIVNDKAYYGNITDGTERLPGQVRESIANDPDSVPADFTVDIDDEVKAISSYKSVPIVFGATSHHRLEGGYDELGRGALTAQIISETVGAVSARSVVRTEYGVFFAGTDGFYVTDGYKATKLSRDWNASYRSWTNSDQKKLNIIGAYDHLQNRIWWGMTTDGAINDICVVLDLNYPLEPTPTWTTVSGGSSFQPTALMFLTDTLYRGDYDGYIFAHADSVAPTDPYKDTTIAATSWGTRPIIWDYQSSFMDFGTAVMRKWATWFHAQIKTNSNIYCALQVRNETDGYDWEDLVPLEKSGDIYWGQPDIIWGDDDLLWNGGVRGFLAQKRAFPANSLRFTYRQIRMSSGLQLELSSTTGETAAINFGTLRVTLTGTEFIGDPIARYLAFSYDGYATKFFISKVISTTEVEVLDPTGALITTSGVAFRIYGYSKINSFSLLDYQITGTPLDKTQEGSR